MDVSNAPRDVTGVVLLNRLVGWNAQVLAFVGPLVVTVEYILSKEISRFLIVYVIMLAGFYQVRWCCALHTRACGVRACVRLR